MGKVRQINMPATISKIHSDRLSFGDFLEHLKKIKKIDNPMCKSPFYHIIATIKKKKKIDR
jgi:hypothetical protein